MPGLSFTILDTPPARPVLTDTGTAFMVGITEQGDEVALSTSFERWKETYGDRLAESPMYDSVETYFREGGSRLYTSPLEGDGSGSGSGDSVDAIEAALALFEIDLGPGQVLVPGNSTPEVHVLIAEHCAENNRRGILDGPNTATLSSLTDAAEAFTDDEENTLGRVVGLWGNWLTIQGLTPSTTRTIPPSPVVAGLIARSDRGKSPNQPAAGLHEIPRTVLGLAESFDRLDVETLADASVNVFADRFQQLQNYGYRSLVLKDEDPAWWGFNKSRLVMAIIANALVVSAQYLFSEIDAERKKLAEFEGALKADAFAPYARSLKAFTVDVTSVAANTDADLATGAVRALCAVQPVDFAESIEFQITNVSGSELLPV